MSIGWQQCLMLIVPGSYGRRILKLSCFPTTHTQKIKKYQKQSFPCSYTYFWRLWESLAIYYIILQESIIFFIILYILHYSMKEWLPEREGIPTNHTKVWKVPKGWLPTGTQRLFQWKKLDSIIFTIFQGNDFHFLM